MLHVKEMLGQRNINSTLIHTHLVDFQADQYVSRVAKSVKGARVLVEAGFEYVAAVDDYKLFWKAL